MKLTNPLLFAFFTLVAGSALFSSAPLAQVIIALVPVVAVMLLWPPGGLPILLMPLTIQWFQVATKPISAALQGVPLSTLSDRGATLEPGFLAASAALMALAIGLRIGVGRSVASLGSAFRHDLRTIGERDLYRIMAACFAVSYIAEFLSNYAGGARQLLLGAANLKLAVIFLMVAWTIVCQRGRMLAISVISIEVILGMTGFFAEYRQTLIVTLFAFLAAAPRVSGKMLLNVFVLGVVTLLLSVFWSSVKPGYREFVNWGSGAQIVDRPLSERLNYLADAAEKFDGVQFEDGLKRLVDRVSYIEFLSFALDGAQYSGNHGGEQTFNALLHILVPRLIYPDKPPLPNDTAVTARYTGLGFQPGDATSISLGYVGELFADFGWTGMLIASLILGAIIGLACRLLLLYQGGSLAMNVSLAILPLSAVLMFETALIKIVGGMVTSLVAALLLQRMILPRLLRVASVASPRRPHRALSQR